ncbi:cupin domain-containing protein [Methylobacter sp. YRD-M1]|uniref:cupin domain-containing protein n=1 Tax=Methylobacter sp. YRD-M1 TaxID=2911520 RepID=UPI00227AEFF7|nr:cupin domain-containing protein [Methylobacter sp. YRD-M1]WAK01706.1 cupin domain-containing protein [Methylobacter sp. YRD-M1]
MEPNHFNIFSDIPPRLPEELFECILKQGNIRIERIVSRGHVTPEGYWYDQVFDEWVILLQGQAVVAYEQDQVCFTLKAGDYLFIPAHVKHRVEWTMPEIDTVWLAVHLLKRDS